MFIPKETILEDFEKVSPYFCTVLANSIMRLKSYSHV